MFDIGDLTPDKLQASATNLVEKNKVQVLINGYGGMGPDIPAFCPYQVPYIHNDATSNVVELRNRMKCRNILMGSDRDTNYGRITFRQLTELSYTYPNKRLAFIHGPYDWELNTTTGAGEVAKELGWDIVLKEEVPYGTKQWSGIISKLRKADPALIYLELLDPASVKAFIDQFMQKPAENALVYTGYTMSVPAFGEIVKQGIADGVLGMTLSAHQPDEAGRSFQKMWQEEYDEKPPFSIAAQIYDELMLWANAVKQVGDETDHQRITRAILESPYQGITGTFSFNKEHFVPAGDTTIPSHLLQAQSSATRQIMIGSAKQGDFVVPPWVKQQK